MGVSFYVYDVDYFCFNIISACFFFYHLYKDGSIF